jgi:hypothetical protein
VGFFLKVASFGGEEGKEDPRVFEYGGTFGWGQSEGNGTYLGILSSTLCWDYTMVDTDVLDPFNRLY